MKCPIGEEPEILLDYCAGRLVAGAAAEVRAHIDGCEACRRFVREQAAVWDALDALPAPRVSRDFDAKLLARIERETPRDAWWALFWTRLPWRPALGFALGCMLVITAVLLQMPQPVDYGQAQADTAESERIERALDDVDMLLQWAAVTDEGRPM